MATKSEIAEKGKNDAALVVNNAFIDGLVLQIQEKEKYGLTFPTGYNYQNELMGAYLILKETVDKDKKPVLESCSQPSIANTLLDMVTMGLSMQRKQCYPIAYGGKLQLQSSVFGNTAMARRYGLKDISAMVIYDKDGFSYQIKDGEIIDIEHTQDFMNIDTDKIKGAYAIAKMQDGSCHVEVMNMSMIKRAWQQGFGYQEGKGTHAKFTDQMCLKTVKNRLLKWLIRTYATQEISDIMDKQELAEVEDRVVADAEYEIIENANTVDFEESTEPEVTTAEQVDNVAKDAPF